MKSSKFKNTLIGIGSAALILLVGMSALGEQGGITQIYKNATEPFDDQEKVDAAILRECCAERRIDLRHIRDIDLVKRMRNVEPVRL